jgi:hypothetical protein
MKPPTFHNVTALGLVIILVSTALHRASIVQRQPPHYVFSAPIRRHYLAVVALAADL